MKTINIHLKTGQILALACDKEMEYINRMVIDLYRVDVANKISSITILPNERKFTDYEKNRYLQCYK